MQLDWLGWIGAASVLAVVVGCGGGQAPRGPEEPARPGPGAEAGTAAEGAADEAAPLERVEALEAEHLRPFWRCALGAEVGPETAEEELARLIETRASEELFSLHLLTDADCVPRLENGRDAFRALAGAPDLPEALAPSIAALADEVERSHAAWRSFAEILSGAPFREALRERMMKAGEAWVGYQVAVADRHDPSKLDRYRPGALAYSRFVACALGEIDYTSFTAVGESTAHDRVVAALDALCAEDPDRFLARVELDCSRFVLAGTPGVADDLFESTVRHWVAQDGDYGSGVPVDECLARSPASPVAAMARQLAAMARDCLRASSALAAGAPPLEGDPAWSMRVDYGPSGPHSS